MKNIILFLILAVAYGWTQHTGEIKAERVHTIVTCNVDQLTQRTYNCTKSGRTR